MTLWSILGGAGLAVVILLGWIFSLVRSGAKAEVIQEIKTKEVEIEKKQSAVIAEHRTNADTSKRMRNGSF